MNPSKSLFALTYTLVIVVSNSFEIPASQDVDHELLVNNRNEGSSKQSNTEESNTSYYTVHNFPKEYKVLSSKSKLNDFHNWFDNKNPKSKVVKIIYKKRIKGTRKGSNNKDSKVVYDWVHSNNDMNDNVESGQSFYLTGNHKSSSSHHRQFENSLMQSQVHEPSRLRNNHRISRIIRINNVKKGFSKNSELTEHSKEGNYNVKYVNNAHDRDGVPDSSDVHFEEYYLPKLKNSKAYWANYDVKGVSHSRPRVSKTMKVVDNDYNDEVTKNHEKFDNNNVISEELDDTESEENSSEEIPPENLKDELHVSEENSNEYMTSEDVNNISDNSQTVSDNIINEDVVDNENFVHEATSTTFNKEHFSKDYLSNLDDNAPVNHYENYEYATPKKVTVEAVNTDVPLRKRISNDISVAAEPKDMPYENFITEDISSENVNSREVPDHDVSSEDVFVENYFNKPTFETNVSSENVSSNDIVSKEVITDDNMSGDVSSEDDVSDKFTSEEIPFNNVIENVDDEDVVSDIISKGLNNEDVSSEKDDSVFKVKPTKIFVMNRHKEISSDVPFENVVNVFENKPTYLKRTSKFEKSVNNDWVTSVNNVYHKPGKVSVPGQTSKVPPNYNPSELVAYETILTEICNKAKKLLRSKPNAAVINRLKLILKELNVLYQFLEKHAHIRIKDRSLPIRILDFINDETKDNGDFYSDQDESSNYNDAEFPDDKTVVPVPIINQFHSGLKSDKNKWENLDGENYSLVIIQLLRDLKRLKPENYDTKIQSQVEQLVKHLQDFLQNNRNNVNTEKLPYVKTYLIPILQALRSQLEKGPESPKLTLKWNIRLLLSFLHGQMNNDLPQNQYDGNGEESQDHGNDPFGKNLYDVLNNSDRSFDDPVNFLVQWLSRSDDNDKMKWSVDESTVRKVLTLFQEKGITIENIRKLIVYLYKNSNVISKNDCTATTYKIILKKSLKFLNFASLLTTKEKWYKKWNVNVE